MPSRTRRTTTPEATTTADSPEVGGQTDEAQELVGNQAIVDIVREHNQSTGEREFDTDKTGIVHVGMNKDAHAEARALNRANRRSGGAVSIRQRGEEQDTVKRGRQEFDLSTLDGAALYAASLGMPDQTAVDAAQFILDGGSGARDELAQLIRVYSEAELGQRKMERVVLSGHSVGSEIWGDENGEIPFDDFVELSEIFPRATAQVRHLMLSACYAGGEGTMQQYFDMFPNLESIVGYHDSSPGTWSGAIQHLEAWEGVTEAGDDPAGVDPEISEGMRKHDNMSTWNVEDGYQGAEPMNVWEIEQDLRAGEATFTRFFDGQEEVANPGSGPLRTYYSLIQRYLAHPQASGGLRASMETRRDVTIRLIYFSVIAGKFDAAYQADLQEGYEEIGREVPAFGSLKRKGSLEEIEAYIAAAGGGKARTLLEGLRDLDSTVIPTSWV